MKKALFWVCVLSAGACVVYFMLPTKNEVATVAVRGADEVSKAENGASSSASLEARLAALERLQGAGAAKLAQQAASNGAAAPTEEELTKEARVARQKQHFNLLFGHLDRVRGSEGVDEVWQTEIRETLSQAVLEVGPAATGFSPPQVACGRSVCRLQLDYDEGASGVPQGIAALASALGQKPNIGGGSFQNDAEGHRVVGYLARAGKGLPRPQ